MLFHAIKVKLKIEDPKHPHFYANGRSEVYALEDIIGFKEGYKRTSILSNC